MDQPTSQEQVLSRLRAHQQELRVAGIEHLALFGSVARQENTPSSDVDLMGDFDHTARLNLFDMVGLESRLSEIVGARVELSDRKMLKQPVKLRAEREAIFAF